MTVVLNCWNEYKKHDVQVTIKALGPLVLFSLGEAMFVDTIRLFHVASQCQLVKQFNVPKKQQSLTVTYINKKIVNVNMYFLYFIILFVQILKKFS